MGCFAALSMTLVKCVLIREACLIGRGIRGLSVDTKATTPPKPTAGFHPSEPSLAGDPRPFSMTPHKLRQNRHYYSRSEEPMH